MKLAILISCIAFIFFHCSGNKNERIVLLADGTMFNTIDSMLYTWIPEGNTALNLKLNVDGKSSIQVIDVNFTCGFWVSKTEVSVKQFQQFVAEKQYITEAEENGHPYNWKYPGFDQGTDHPVVYISVKDARKYMSWVGGDLPTQEEWIYAMKAQSTSKYYWGDDFDDHHLWYRMNASSGTKPVGTKTPNSWGLHDMIGNVYEYTTVCDSSYRAIGASWTRCNEYYSHIPGDTVRLSIGQIDNILLHDCSVKLINPYNDDTGFRIVIRP